MCLLSPAKAMRELAKFQAPKGASTPIMAEQTKVLLSELKGYSAAQLSKLMGISDALGKLNNERYQTWEDATDYVAIDLFDGEAFKSLDVDSMSAEDRQQMNKSLVVLSGLYGMIKPDDAIRPYRLEMGTKFEVDGAKNLVNFWHQHGLTDALAEHAKAVGAKIILNCASEEYAKAIDFKKLEKDHDLQVLRFKGVKAGGARGLPGVFSKQARGMMTRFVIQSKVASLEDLKAFTGTEGRFKFLRVDGNEVLFERSDQPKQAAAKKPATKKKTPVKKDGSASAKEEKDEVTDVNSDETEKATKGKRKAPAKKVTTAAAEKDSSGVKEEAVKEHESDSSEANKKRRVQPSRRARAK